MINLEQQEKEYLKIIKDINEFIIDSRNGKNMEEYYLNYLRQEVEKLTRQINLGLLNVTYYEKICETFESIIDLKEQLNFKDKKQLYDILNELIDYLKYIIEYFMFEVENNFLFKQED